MASTMDAAQALLTAFDTSMSKHWREEDRRWRAEDRGWRAEDVVYREFERSQLLEEKEMRELEKLWREEDMEQRHVDNARYLWARFVEKNRRNVEEKSEQLKAISNLSALFAGFAVVTLTQFGFDYTKNPTWIVACFGVLTAISICLHTIAMVLCTLILGSVLKNGKSYVDEEAEEEFMFRCKAFIETYQIGLKPPAPRRTFEAFWDYRCEADWRLAFNLFTWGVFSFLLELIPIGWIKFYYSPQIAGSFTAICIVSITIWLWTQCSWGSYLTNKYNVSATSTTNSFRATPAGLPFDWHIAPGENLLRGQAPAQTMSESETPSQEDAAFFDDIVAAQEAGSFRESNGTSIGKDMVPEDILESRTQLKGGSGSNVGQEPLGGSDPSQAQVRFMSTPSPVVGSNHSTDGEGPTSPNPLPGHGRRTERSSPAETFMPSGEFALDEPQYFFPR